MIVNNHTPQIFFNAEVTYAQKVSSCRSSYRVTSTHGFLEMNHSLLFFITALPIY